MQAIRGHYIVCCDSVLQLSTSVSQRQHAVIAGVFLHVSWVNQELASPFFEFMERLAIRTKEVE